jgi:hypothetical protein
MWARLAVLSVLTDAHIVVLLALLLIRQFA